MTEYLRFPILYERASDDTSTLGLGFLSGIMTGTVTRDANAVGVLNLTYNPADPLAKELTKGRIIMADCGPDSLRQKFRITRVVKSGTVVTVEANQIWGDLAYDVISQDISIANASPVAAFNAITAALADPIPALNFSSDITKVANLGWTYKDTQNVLDILIGADQAGEQTNTMQALYNGEWVADNYNLKLLQHGGQDTHIVVKYGRNVQTIEQDEAIDKTYTAIMPYATYTPDSTSDTTDTSTAYSGVGIVQYVGTGGLQMYDTPYAGHKVVGTVQNGTYYKVSRQASDNTVNHDTWYEIGTNNWVDGTFFTFDKSGTYVVNQVAGSGTITIGDNTDSTGLIVPFQGVGSVVSYAGPKSIAIWTSPFADKKATGEYVGNGERFKIWYKATDSAGHVWYNIGTNSWIDSAYFSVEKNTDFVIVPARGICIIKTDDAGGASVYTAPGGAGYVQRHVVNGSKWQVTGEATGGDGNTWYRIATNQWITSDVCDFSSNGTVTPTTVDDKNTEEAQALGKVPIYPSPTYNVAPTGQYLQAGSRWKITAQADNNGTTWYEVATNEWVDSKWFSFTSADDVTPAGPSDSDSDDEVADITVQLPELILKSDLAANDERLRVLPVDLSDYNIQDADKLRQVAQAYMQDYRIGYPVVTLTLNYAQMTGDYAALTEIGLYDRVAVEFDQLNIAEDAEVSETVWDIPAHRYDTITIGEPPISYTHMLKQYQQQAVEKSTQQASKQATGLFDRIHAALQKQGSDQDAAVENVMKELGIQGDSLNAVKNQMEIMDQTVTDVSDWINSSGTAVIQAYPNWQAPTDLRAVNDDGSYMKFDANGLGFYSSGNLVRTAIDSQGRLVAENITAGTVTGLKLDSVQITGTSGISLNDGNGGVETEISAAHGISTGGGLEAWSWSRFHQGVDIYADLYVANDIRTVGSSIYFGDGSNALELKYVESGGYKGQGLYINYNGADHHIVTD